MANQRVKITKTFVEKTPMPASGQDFYRDCDISGFGLRVTPCTRSFILEKRIAGKMCRLTVGRYPDLTVEQARKETLKLLSSIATGGDPVAEKQEAKRRGITVAQAFEDFLAARKNLKEKTLYDYGRMIETVFQDWKDKPIKSITKDMVAKRHTYLGENHGKAQANLAMRFLSSLINFAIVQYETNDGKPLIYQNPVSRLTQTRAWYRQSRRMTVIKAHQLSAWYKALCQVKQADNSPQAATICDYLLFLIFTGMRRQEAASLQWEDVDLKEKTLLIRDTKNHLPHQLPLSDFLVDLLKARRDASTSRYVFSGEGRTGYLIEPRKQMIRIMIATGITFSIHDLRRTFITIAESLDISAYALKRLVNHKMNNDVTAGYIISDVERLREPMNRITNFLLKSMGVISSAEIITLDRLHAN